jgi:hypothetical protein
MEEVIARLHAAHATCAVTLERSYELRAEALWLMHEADDLLVQYGRPAYRPTSILPHQVKRARRLRLVTPG